MEHVSKTFGTQQVLRDVAISIMPGEVRALVGENGSGKSTLVKILAGVYEPDAGAVIRAGGAIIDPASASGTGALRFVHQDLGLVDILDTVDNLALNVGYTSLRRGMIRPREEARHARNALTVLGQSFDVHRPVGALTATERTAVAVARALSEHRGSPRLLVLDEPTANLPAPEVERLIELIRTVSARGVAVLYISHHLEEVFQLADSVTVLRDGQFVATKSVADIDEHALLRLMLGREFNYSSAHAESGEGSDEVLLSIEGLRGATVHDINMDVRAHEIVGIAGISGSGREEFAPLVFSSEDREGRVQICGTDLPAGRPDIAMSHGLGLVPADRRTTAAFMEATLRDNVTIADQRPNIRWGMLRRRLERLDAQGWLERLNIRKFSEDTMSELSGGNQQRVVLARWLRLRPKVLLLDEPTQGVDVGAKAAIHDILRDYASRGLGLVVASTDHDELARLCHRVVVLRNGVVEKELRAPNLSAESLTLAAVGAHHNSVPDDPTPRTAL